MKIGILRETKVPPDRRVPLTPEQCRRINEQKGPLNVVVQPSGFRCFSDQEYKEAGVPLQEDLSDCDFLLGVKEVKTAALLPGKNYLFFSHTAKKQAGNRGLLQHLVKNGNRMTDYEYLVNEEGVRVVAFGHWAGVVGAYNGLRAWGLRNGTYTLKPAWECLDYNEVQAQLRHIRAGEVRIAITGGGRVAGGALEVLRKAGFREVDHEGYLNNTYNEPVFTRLDPWNYTRRSDGRLFNFNHFVRCPGEYDNAFGPFAMATDIYMACHFWDPAAPPILTREMLLDRNCPVKVVADISCDLDGPVASTLRASTIAEPFYGYDPQSDSEAPEPFARGIVTVMAVDNLPGELPRDASAAFGTALTEHVIPALSDPGNEMIVRATITANGALAERYAYLEDFLKGEA
ncbi:MAG: NAD(P)-dependent oxidoreductase [Bacteroidota bacterium]